MNCIWKQDVAGECEWDTSCGGKFTLNEGTPKENKMAFCCYCGSVLVEYVAEEEEDV